MDSNSALLKWLQRLKPNFQSWELLNWSCIYKNEKREHSDDIRNQLVHNLLGVQQHEVIQYLLGNKTDDNYKDALITYQEIIKKPFLHEIDKLGLKYNERNLHDELEAIANDI